MPPSRRPAAPSSPALLDRPRVHLLLDRAATALVTVVVACPGSGKRCALRGWFRARGHDALWVPAPGDAPALADAIATELERVRRPAADRFRAALGDAEPTAASLTRGLRAVVARRERTLWVVLDAAAGPPSPEAEALAAQVLDDPPERLRLLLVARQQPVLPLGRHRVDGRVADVEADDLRFTPEEVAALVRRRTGHPAPDDVVARMLEATDGWAAGVGALSRAFAEEAGGAGGGAWLARGRRRIDTYLAEEVVGPLPADQRQVLVRTALLETLDAETAAVALPAAGDAATARRLLDRLAAADLLVPDDATGHRRVRVVLRPFLRQRFADEVPPGEARALARRLAARCVEADRADEAIGMLVEVGDLPAAVAVLDRVVDGALAREAWHLLRRWLDRFPEPALEAYPEVLAARCWLAHLSGRFAALPDLVARMVALDAERSPDDPGRRARAGLAEALSFTSLVPIERDPADALARLERARGLLPPSSRLGEGINEKSTALALHGLGRGDEAVARLTEWTARRSDPVDAAFARGVQALAFVHWQAGRIDACEQAAETLLDVAQRHDLPLAGGWGGRFLGRVAYERDRTEQAGAWFEAVVADPRSHRACFAEAAAGLALALAARGRPEAALALLGRAVDEVAEVRGVHLLAMLHATEQVVAVRAGLTTARDALGTTVAAGLDQMSLHAQVHPVAARAELLLADGTPASLDEAERHVAALGARAVACRHLPATVVAELLGAVVASRRGRPRDAEAAVERAAALGVPAGLHRTYADLAPLLRPVLEQLPAAMPGRDWARVAALVAVRPAVRPRRDESAPSRPSPLEVLTLREAEVLGLLAQHLSYQEIGAALSISPGTVKFHLRSVYGKLGVDGRRAALLRAADLGWRLGTESRRA